MECKCKQIIGIENIKAHIAGCPESFTYKEWKALSFWKRLFIRNPQKDYLISLRAKNML